MNGNSNIENTQPALACRVVALDALRGATIISMVLFHTAYDLAYIYGLSLPWFTSGIFQDAWRDSISWTFLLLAGWMTGFSRNNYKRSLEYGIAALLVFLASSIASVDAPISFGIIYCMAASTLLWTVFERFIPQKKSLTFSLVFLFLFLITKDVPNHVYDFSHLSWLGFPGPGFYSGDYYPLVPFFFMYACGACLQRAFANSERTRGVYPDWMYQDRIPILTTIGRHGLAIYLIHQPVVLAILELLGI